MIADPAQTQVNADLKEPNFLAGIAAGRWRVIDYTFPILEFMVTATEPDRTTREYGFRADLSNYPAQAPMVRIWDHISNKPLDANKRPTGSQKLQTTFQAWGEDTVYRPWERKTGPHNSNAASLKHLAWRPTRHLCFIFEDLHGILNSNARAHRIRATA